MRTKCGLDRPRTGRIRPRGPSRTPLNSSLARANSFGAASAIRTPDLRITSRKQGISLGPITPAPVRRRPRWSIKVLAVGCQRGCQPISTLATSVATGTRTVLTLAAGFPPVVRADLLGLQRV